MYSGILHGYQIIITVLVISTLNANLRVATRVYDVEGGAIFSKNSTFVFFDGVAWTPRLRSPSPIMAPVGCALYTRAMKYERQEVAQQAGRKVQ